MGTKHIIVHLRLGYDYNDTLSKRILAYIKDKNPDDVVFLSDQVEFDCRERYSTEYGFPKECFHPSSDGHFEEFSLLGFKDSKAEVIGYHYSKNRVNCCVNNAASDLKALGFEVGILEELVKISSR